MLRERCENNTLSDGRTTSNQPNNAGRALNTVRIYNVYIYLYRSRRANSRRLCVALSAEYTAGTAASIKNVGVSVADYRSSMLPSRNHPITTSLPCRPRASVILSLRHTHEGLKKPNARVCSARDRKKKVWSICRTREP